MLGPVFAGEGDEAERRAAAWQLPGRGTSPASLEGSDRVCNLASQDLTTLKVINVCCNMVQCSNGDSCAVRNATSESGKCYKAKR